MKETSLFIAALCLSLSFMTALAKTPPEPAVYVFLWFDTEDYILPASDDAALRLSQFLTREGIRATFKLVGEKARVLEKRGRRDVLEALARHEIGYHTNFHSVQPTPALYLSPLGWDEGVAEFDRRERQGILDIERITGQRPTCYGQPGSSWGPQQFGAMKQWGMQIYLDAGSHVSLDGKPFWYCGILNLYALEHTLRTGLQARQELEEAKKEFREAYQELLAEGGGVVSIYYHPCEFVHARFWDAVNFSHGANPARSEWKLPPRKSPENSRLAYQIFEEYMRYIKSHPRVHFVTASQAPELYGDAAPGREFSHQEIKDIATYLLQEGLNYQVFDGFSLALSEQFSLLIDFIQQGKTQGGIRLQGTPLGPTGATPAHAEVKSEPDQFKRTVTDVEHYLNRHQRIPSTVWLGSTPIGPESFLLALAEAALRIAEGRALSEPLVCRPAHLALADRVRNDKSLWGWVIFPRDFEAPAMMELAKRQAWTLKPALLRE